MISADQLGAGPSELAIVVPITTTDRQNRLRVRIEPPEAGLTEISFAMPEMLRSISRERLVRRLGLVRPGTVETVLYRVRLLMRSVA